MANERRLTIAAGTPDAEGVKISTEQVLDQLHQNYTQIISQLTEQNAALQAALTNTEGELAELRAFKEAMMEVEEESVST